MLQTFVLTINGWFLWIQNCYTWEREFRVCFDLIPGENTEWAMFSMTERSVFPIITIILCQAHLSSVKSYMGAKLGDIGSSHEPKLLNFYDVLLFVYHIHDILLFAFLRWDFTASQTSQAPSFCFCLFCEEVTDIHHQIRWHLHSRSWSQMFKQQWDDAFQ